MTAGPQTGRVRWATRATLLALQDPVEGIDRAALRLGFNRAPAARPETTPEWQARLHTALGVAWPCEEFADFADRYAELTCELREKGLTVGRGAYGGWDDADRAFASAVWCLAAHTRARVLVETGVARGFTSRLLLEHCERLGAGHLWSIDLPPIDSSLHEEIGSAVPERVRSRWTYIRGSSRKRLAGVLRNAGPVDLFVHDSLHTVRNVMFELGLAWPALVPGGAAIVDDVHRNDGFTRFAEATSDAIAIVADHSDCQGAFGLLVRAR